MQQSRLLNTVPKLKNVMMAKDSLYNEIVSLVDSHNVKFTNTNVETLGKSHLTELLWHITSPHTYFEEWGAKVPGAKHLGTKQSHQEEKIENTIFIYFSHKNVFFMKCLYFVYSKFIPSVE